MFGHQVSSKDIGMDDDHIFDVSDDLLTDPNRATEGVASLPSLDGSYDFDNITPSLPNLDNLDKELNIFLGQDDCLGVGAAPNPLETGNFAKGRLGVNGLAENLDSTMIPRENVFDPINSWTGNYGFKVSPLVEGRDKKKWCHSENFNKIYCGTNVSIPFKFEMTHEAEAIGDLKIRASLIFEDDDLRTKPVMRCENCIRVELREQQGYKPEQYHMIRPTATKDNSDILYFRDEETGRTYLTIPVKSPEPGLNFMTRNFIFTCNNSHIRIFGTKHTSGEAKPSEMRNIGILFVLFKRGEIVGRSFMRLRVCSAPTRDFKKDEEKHQAEKRKAELPANVGQNKRIKLPNSVKDNFQSKQRNHDDPVVRINVSVDEQVSSSQETTISVGDGVSKISLRTLVGEIKWVMKQKKSPNEQLRWYYQHVLNNLLGLQGMCTAARRLAPGLAPITEVNERSPDAGFIDNEGEGGVE